MIETANLFGAETPTMDAVWEWYEQVQPERAKKPFELNMTKEESLNFYLG